MESILSAHEIGEGLPVLIIHGWQMEGRVEELDFEPIFKKHRDFAGFTWTFQAWAQHLRIMSRI
jgi:hypothetical protein